MASGGVAAVVGDPALDEPGGVAEALGEGGGGLEDAGLRGRWAAAILRRIGVDHAGGVGLAGGAAELDALAEGGVGGDAVHVQELEGAQAQGDGDGLGETLARGARAGCGCGRRARSASGGRP